VSSTETVIQHEHRYSDNYGIHVINVRGFNLANNDTASANVDVLEWNCETSNISIDPLFTNQNTPFTSFTEDGFNITANITVDCMKMEQYNARWEIVDASDQTLVATLANGSQFVSAPNALLPGAYVIEINVTMWSNVFDLSDKTAISYAYVNIERCQSSNVSVDLLFANEDHPYTALLENSFTVTIDYSFDCASMEQYNIRWDILNSTQHNLSTVPNATELVILPNDLPAGSYVIRISITMWSSVFDLSDKSTIAYAYVNIENCQPPNVTLNPLASESKPFTAMDNDGFTVTAYFSVYCPPMEQLNAQWDILDYSQQSVLRTLPNATQLISLPYDLPVGFYVIRLNTTISSSCCDLSQKSVIACTYVNVNKSFLVAGIDGSSYINATFNSSVYLSAYNVTYASDTSHADKSGMIFEWRCKRTVETWPTQMPSQYYLPHKGTNGGCFDDVGPGVLGFAANQWNFTINTGYLEPLIEYAIQFMVQKDTHSANASVSLYVQQPLAPNISIRQVYYY